MTLAEFFAASYGWADQHAAFILAVALLLPALGTALAWLGKGGRSDADGRFIASAVMGVALFGVLLELSAIFVARSFLGASLLGANLMLLVAPAVCLAGSVLGIRLVFPLSQLGSVKTAADLGLFLLACGGLLWLMSKFRGWGVLFLGSFLQLIVVGVLALLLLWRLYRRAFGLSARASADPQAPASLSASSTAPGSPLVAGALALGVVALAAGALFGLWQLTRPAAAGPAAATGSAASSAPSQALLSAPGLAQPRPASPASSAYSYLDEDGAQHFVQSLEQVPPRFRAQARPVE